MNVQIYLKILKKSNKKPLFKLSRGIINLKNKKYELGIKRFEKALSNDNTNINKLNYICSSWQRTMLLWKRINGRSYRYLW